MPSSRNGGNIKFGIDFEANQASLNKLKKSLQDLQKINFGEGFSGSRQEFDEVKSRLTEIQNLAKNAFNPTLNTSNITAFKAELEKSGMSLKQIQSDFSRFGSTGDRAFNQLATSVLTTNLKLKETNSLIDNMGKTMVNTVKWGIASSVMNTFTQSVQGAFQYVQSLEKSLTNIRIVTGDSTEKMAQFAEQANRSAQALGRSTLDYTKASLTYYQQGLNDEDVQARTEATLKAQNITGAGSQMADYLTSVWNGYKVANEEAELYVDKLAAVADSSASDMSQLAIAMSKVASTANTMGVDIDQLNAQIATVVATTRQAPESVGTAFKTIYTRMNDIKTGADDAEVSLGKYSGTMASLGFNVLDTTGHLRDTGQVMEEIGGRWQDLTREQQIYLAQTMGGQRQVNQLMALFDNWTTYSELLNTSLESEGTLAEKNSRYMESLGAKMEQLGAAGERVKDALIDSDSMKTVIESLTSVTNLVANLFETMGSGQTVLLALGSTMTQLFSGTIAKEINNVIVNMQNMKTNAQTIKNQLEMTKMVQDVGKDTKGGILVADRMAEIQQYYSVMDEASINNQKNLIRERAQLQNNIQTINQEREEVEKIAKSLDENTILDWSAIQGDSFENINVALGNMETSLKEVKELSSKDLFTGIFDSNATTESTFINSFNKFIEDYKQIDPTKATQLAQAFDKFTSNQMSGGAFFNKLNAALDEANQKTNKLSETIGKSGQALSDATGRAEVLDKAIKNGADSAKQLFDVTNAVKMISAVGQITSAFMTIKNLGSIWSDKDVSTGEKIAKTLTTAGFIIPSLYHAMKNISVATGITAALQERRLKINKELTLQQKLQTKQKEKQAALEAYENLMEKAGDGEEISKAFIKVEEIDKEIKGLKTALSGVSKEVADTGGIISTAFGAAGESVSSFIGILSSIAGPLSAIGVVVAIGYTIYKVYNSAADAAKQASENAEKAKQTYDELKNSYKDLTTALEDYHGAKDALSELVKGTEEWYDKVNELNDKVLELLQHYPELAEYVSMNDDGLLSISEQGETFIKNQQRQRVYTAGMANANLQQQKYQADRNSKITDMGRDLYGLFGGKETLQNIIAAVDNYGNGVLGDEKRLQSLGFTDEQIATTQENTSAILQLINSINAEQIKVDALKDSIIRTNLNNEKEYQASQNKEAFSDIYSKGLKQATASLGEQFYKKVIVDEYGNEQQVLDQQKILDTYTQLTGKELRQSLFGGLSAETQNGQFEKTTFEAIKSYVEQSQANVDTAKLLEETANRLSQAEKNFANQDDRTKNLLFNSGLAGGFDKVNTNQLSEGDINRLQGLNQKNIDLADYLGLSQQDVTKGLEQLKVDIQTGVTDFIEGIENTSVRETLKNLQSKNTYLSKELAETIAQNLEDGLNLGGSDAKKAISDFYQKFSDEQLQSAIKVADSYNLATGSVQNFRKTLQEAGINTNHLSDQIIEAFLETEKEIQNIKAENYRTDPEKIANGSSTLGLVQQQAKGEHLSDKELEALKTGLEDLLQVYPKLTQQIQTLKEAGLVGTSSYEQALRKLKMAFIESYQDMAAAGTISLEQISQQMSNYVKTSEDLQMVQNAGIFTFQDYSQKLKLIANQYDSCKDELQQYILALQSHNEVAAATTQFMLELALRSAENGEKYGIEAERISDLAKRYVELANEGVQAYQGLNENAELASDAAVRYIRLNDSIESLQKNFTAVSEVLNALSTNGLEEVLGDADYAKTFEQIKENVAGILDVSSELVNADFIKEYAQQIKEAANGSQEAVDILQEAFAEDIIANIKIDDQEFYDTLGQTKEQFANWLNDLPEGEINLDENPAIQSLVTLLEQAGYSKDQIEDLFSGANIDLDLGYPDTSGVVDAVNDATDIMAEGAANASDAYAENAGVDVTEKTETSEQTDNVEAAGVEATLTPQQADVSFPRVAAMAIPGVGFLPQLDGTVPGHITYYGVNVEPKVEKEQATKTNTAVGLEVKGATKSSGGKVSHKNSSGGNKKASKGGGGKKGGGGGGSKAKEPNKAKGATNKADRYRNNTVKANKLANQMTKLNKQQERLTGKDALKNLQKQLEILEKQKDVIRERLGLQRDEQNELANNLKKYGATFDKDGTLNNYFITHDKILKEYNDKVAEWNQMTAEQQESNKDYLNNAKEIMDQAFKDLERYDKLQQEIAKTQQEQIDKTQEQIDLKVKQLDLKIKAELDLSEAKRDWNKFQRDIVNEIRNDDILGLNRFRFADIASYYNDAGTGSIQNLTDRLKEVMADENGIFSGSYLTQQLANMSITDRAAQLEKIKEIFDDLQDQMEGFKEIADEIKESIFDAIDAAQDAFDEQMDEYEYLGDLIDHNMKVTQMFFGDEAYDQMAKFYDRIEENNNAQLDFLAKQKDLWYSRMVEEQARMDQLAQTQGTDSNIYKEARDRFEEYKKHWMDTVKDLNSTVEDALDNIMDKYNNAINEILANFELKLGDGHTLDDIGDEWDILNDQADRYFDKINAAYEIDKLENAFNDAIDDNDGNIAAQQSLNDLMEQQLAYLRDKERLTQYDVDRANTLLQIEMKRLALEQSRSNKNRLRLRRDSQGNYTYQYTADTDAINKAEQELADARNSLYNSDKAAYVDNLSDIQKSAENIKNKLKDIYTDTTLSDEQRLQKTYELEKYYGDQINKLLEDNANIRNNLIQSSTEELARIYGINIEQFQALSDKEQTDILKDLIPQAGSYLSDMVEELIGQGGVGKLFDDSINRFLQAEDERINSIAEIEKNGQISFEDIINDTNTVIGQAEQLIDNNEALINSYEQELNAVQNTINGVNELIQTYERAKQAAIQATTAANDLLISNDAETIGSSLDREKAAQNVNDNILNSWIANGNSYGDLSNFTPYAPNWHSSDFAAIFGSSNVGLSDLANYQDTLQNATSNILNNIVNQDGNTTPINVNSILDTIESNVSHINDILEALYTDNSNYYANVLDKAKDIEKAIVTNQTVHIDADFPNAKDVRHIIEAIEGLANAAAQRANSKGY